MISACFYGEIRMFAGSFAPVQWAFCDGQLLAVSQYATLFSLLGTIYGGDGRSSFALPEMRGRLPMHYGTGPGLTPRPLGQRGGSETVELTVAQLPPHTHTLVVTDGAALSNVATDTVVLAAGQRVYSGSATAGEYLADQTVGDSGGSRYHLNEMPYLSVNFIIALTGTDYPSRN